MTATMQEHPLSASAILDSPPPRSEDLVSDAASYRSRYAANPTRDWRLVASGVCALTSAFVFGLGWLGISGTADVYKQMPYLISAGGPGILLIGLALGLFLNYEHTADRVGIALVLSRLEQLERDNAVLTDEVRSHLVASSAVGQVTSNGVGRIRNAATPKSSTRHG